MSKQESRPYIVLLGNVGSGKSTLVEKVTGVQGRSADNDESVTRASELFHTADNSLIICDTPGTNPITEKFDHNIQIAHALNLYPVSRILIVVQAHMRIDNVIDDIRKYAERFADLVDILGVLVTHMDEVYWEKSKFKSLLDQELGLTDIVFSGIDTAGNILISELKSICGQKLDLTITSDNFLKYFKINNNNLKILKCTKKEIGDFEVIKQDFYDQLHQMDRLQQVDCIFEFQAWMFEQIIEAQKRISTVNNFEFEGPNMADEAGHIANLTNQLRAVLHDVRTQALGLQEGHGVTSLRKCPHCGLIWAKVEGCDGATTCGNRVESLDGRKGVLATFTFQMIYGRLRIIKTGERKVERVWGSLGKGKIVGCGKSVEWKNMAPVQVPIEFNIIQTAHTEDVNLLPSRARRSWRQTFKTKFQTLRKRVFPYRR